MEMDKRRQELEELQDDIHLALLMDEYAESMGAEVRAEAEKAFETGEITIPQEMDDACASILAQTTKAEHSRKSTKNVIRYLLVAVGTVIALLGTLVVVQAAGVDVFGRLASWTDSVFHYKAKEKPVQAGEAPFSEIKAALSDLGLPTEFAPQRLPEGYAVINIKQFKTNEMILLTIVAEKNGKESQIVIEEYMDVGLIENAQWEKSALPAKVFSSNGRDFFLIENDQGWSGTWSDGRYVITLFDFESYEDITNIILTIGEH